MNLENSNQPSEGSPEEIYGLTRRHVFAGIAAFAVTGFLAGCTAEPEKRYKQFSQPTKQPIEVPLVPEVMEPLERQGINGEYFSTLPAWEQDFTVMPESPLDTTNWNILTGPGPGNSEAQYYTNSTRNVRVENGKLVLQAHVEDSNGYDYTSGRIDTLGKNDFLYGKFEISAKIPRGVGTWPAAWLLPSEEIYLNQYPGVNFNSYYVDGEIDVMEAIGSDQNTIYGITHSLDRPENPEYREQYYSTKAVPDADITFHTYGLEWTPTNLTMSVDGEKFYSVSKQDYYDFRQWPYDQKFHLIINLAMGGDWAGRQTDLHPTDGIDKQALPATFEVASVKYYSFVPNPTP